MHRTDAVLHSVAGCATNLPFARVPTLPPAASPFTFCDKVGVTSVISTHSFAASCRRSVQVRSCGFACRSASSVHLLVRAAARPRYHSHHHRCRQWLLPCCIAKCHVWCLLAPSHMQKRQQGTLPDSRIRLCAFSTRQMDLYLCAQPIFI